MTFEQIRSVVIGRLVSWAGIPADNIDFPNAPVPFDPSGKDIWAALTNLPGMSSTAEIGGRPCYRRTGVMMVQLYVPRQTGTIKITRAADTLAEHFEGYSEAGVEFYAASVTASGSNSDWYQITVSVPYTTTGV